MHDRLAAAEALVKAERYDEATKELIWLWENMDRVDPGMRGVRVSFMAKEIEDLANKHAPARQRFCEIRERTAQLADADIETSKRLRFDWIVLNEILSDTARTLAWFDAVKEDARYAGVLDGVASCLIPLLKSHQRYRDIGRLYRDPVATLVRTHSDLQPPPHIAADPYPDPNPNLRPDLQRLMRSMLQEILNGLSAEVIE